VHLADNTIELLAPWFLLEYLSAQQCGNVFASHYYRHRQISHSSETANLVWG
jgi:hypothetical protein